jgi:hypothetical protein
MVDGYIFPFFSNNLAFSEEDDPEYIFQEFDEFCQEEEEDDNYEFRKDRATEIPRWELKALEQDFVDVVDAELPEPFAQIPILTSLNVPIESRPQSKQAIHRHVKQTEPMPTNADDEEERNNNNIISTTSTRPSSSNESSTVGSVFLIDGSCSLLAPQLIFTKDELEALKVQLEKVFSTFSLIISKNVFSFIFGLKNFDFLPELIIHSSTI